MSPAGLNQATPRHGEFSRRAAPSDDNPITDGNRACVERQFTVAATALAHPEFSQRIQLSRRTIDRGRAFATPNKTCVRIAAEWFNAPN